MGFGIEKVGNYDIKPLGDGKYSVTCNNGNIGACIMDEECLKQFKEKYSGNSDTVELSSKAPKMSYEEAKSIEAMTFMDPLAILGLSPFANPDFNPLLKDAMIALEYYRNNGTSDAVEIASQAPKMSYEEARNTASMLTIPGGSFFALHNPKTKEAVAALEYYRNNGVA